MAEWIAAGLGLVLTLIVIGYTLWQVATDKGEPPTLAAIAGAPRHGPGGFTVPVTVRNTGDTTAAAVEVSGRLMARDAVLEESRASFAYVPGDGEARGGLVFQTAPAGHRLVIKVEGYEEP